MTETAKRRALPLESSFDRDTQRLARVYAKALFQAAAEHKQVDAIRDELDAFFEEVMPIDPAVANFFTSGSLGRERRAEILEKVMVPYVSELVGNLMMVLNAHERLQIFAAVIASYMALCDSHSGKIKVQVSTPAPLTPPERDSLVDRLRTLLKQEPSLDESVEPALIGGMTIKVGDYVYDASVRTRLQEIRKQLIARSSYEIQSGRDRFSTAD
jgi:F-type H+-transporting ATPase subunit delta